MALARVRQSAALRKHQATIDYDGRMRITTAGLRPQARWIVSWAEAVEADAE